MSRASLFIPLTVFVLLAVVLYAGFGLNDAHVLPSALLNKPFPKFSLPRLDASTSPLPAQQVSEAAVKGSVHLVNVWGTWCPTCAAEHPTLMRLAQEEGMAIIGVDYKDDAEAARAWLQQRGNPYTITVVDAEGTLGLDLGVYGAPETFLVDAAGVIRFKWVGDMNERVWREQFKPRLAAIRSASRS